MPFSTSKFKTEIKSKLIELFPDNGTTIVDIGAGAGAYSDLLRDYYPNIDAVEIWEPYIAQYKLNDKYRRVFQSDAFDFFAENGDLNYDVGILGDVLEHFTEQDAKRLIDICMGRCSYLIVVVPFNCEQDEAFGNKYERHMQPDLDLDRMDARYGKDLELLMHGFHRSDADYEIAVYQSRRA